MNGQGGLDPPRQGWPPPGLPAAPRFDFGAEMGPTRRAQVCITRAGAKEAGMGAKETGRRP